MSRFIQTLEEVIETEERRRKELKERAQKLQLNDETVSLIKEYDYALFHLIFSLKSIVSELKDIYRRLREQEERESLLLNEFEKAEKRIGKDALERTVSSYKDYIIEAIKRASKKKFGKENYPVRPEDILNEFRTILPDARISSETITRAVRKMAELGIIIRVRKGLYKIKEVGI